MTKSCGCLVSFGETTISRLLQEASIPFERQKAFENCVLPSGYLAHFDFFVNNNYLIEYDGE